MNRVPGAFPRLVWRGAKAKAVVALAVAGAGAVAVGASLSTSPPSHGHHRRLSHLVVEADGCRPGSPLANVYHPYRLKVRVRCLTVVGTVAYIRREDDGDVHVALRLPAGEDHLLNRYNDSEQYHQLVTEIVPADQPHCILGRPPRPAHGTYDYGVCTGADIHTPPMGALVKVTGPYVLDADHGWMEIHPVWRIVILRRPTPTTTTSSSTTTTTPPPATIPPATAAPAVTTPSPNTGVSTTVPLSSAPATTLAGAWCKASSVPANDGYSGDFDIHVSSDEPYTAATAHSATDTYSYETNAQGAAVVYLWHQDAGEAVTVTVGSATCHATDP